MTNPTPTPDNMRDIFTIFQFINNDLSNGIFFPIILAVTWIIFFLIGLTNGRAASRSWIFSSFVCTILAILLGLMGMLNRSYIYFLVLMVAFGMLWLRFDTAPS